MRDAELVNAKARAAIQPRRLSVARQRALVAVAILFATLALLWPTTETLLVKWMDVVSRSYTHGPLIVLMAAFLLWRSCAVPEAVVRHSWAGAVVLALLGVFWLATYRSGIQLAHQALLPLIFMAALWTMFGAAFLRRVWIAVGFLFFAIPVWDILVPLLQWLSVFAVRAFLSVLGIPVYFDGLEFQIPAGHFEIAGGCSGLHFLNVAVALAVFYGELHDDTLKTRIKLLCLAVVFALLTNWVRITIIIVAGHLTDMQHYLVSGEHYSFGWMIFAVAMIVFFLIVRRWPSTARAAPASAQVITAASRSWLLPGLPLVGAALLLPALLYAFDANEAAPQSAARHAPPATVAGWVAADSMPPLDAPFFSGADQESRRRFTAGDRSVDVFVSSYLQQRQEKELAGFLNRPQGRDSRTLEVAASADGRWQEMTARDAAGNRWLTWLSYRVDDRWFGTPLRSQVAYAFGSLIRDPVSSAIVLRAPCAQDCAAARDALGSFAAAARLAPAE
jgi:exosortase